MKTVTGRFKLFVKSGFNVHYYKFGGFFYLRIIIPVIILVLCFATQGKL